MHDDDGVGHGHGLDLVVGDVDGRGVEPLVERLDLGAHLDPELGVEVGERLVEEEDGGLAHEGTAHGDALALAAGELGRQALEQRRELEHAGGTLDGVGDPLHRCLPHLQAEGEVLVDRHVRVEGVGLEDHGDAAVAGMHAVDHPAGDADVALGDRFQPGGHAQERGLAAAGRADEDDERAFLDLQVDAVQDRHRPEILLQPLVFDVAFGHRPSPKVAI